MEEDIMDTSNINEVWLKNLFEQLKATQSMERLAREGCNDLMEYMQIPYESRGVILPDVCYKNLRFFALELKILISNLTPILEGDEVDFMNKLKPVLDNINKRHLFLKDKKVNGQLVRIDTLPFMDSTIMFISNIKSDIIKSIKHLLYIKQGDKTEKEW